MHLMEAARQSADQVFSLIRDELARFEVELARQVGSNLRIVTEIGRYLQDGGGKRLRPALLLLASKLRGKPVTPAILRLAVVVELLHTATLVHDDIIDGAEIRRGRPSVNARWGNQITVLMGDWLYMTAFELTLKERNFEVLDILTTMTRKMTEGELIQLTQIGNLKITREQYFEILQRKTAYLFSAGTEIGAIMGGASPAEQRALREYGLNLGTAFQLIDDVLDFTSSGDHLGKPAGNDLREGKLTLPVIYLVESGTMKDVELIKSVVADGDYRRVKREDLVRRLESHGALERARGEAAEYALRACACVDELPPSLYKEALVSIARFTVERSK
jgi:octaprenyl-diphosphate synthase